MQFFNDLIILLVIENLNKYWYRISNVIIVEGEARWLAESSKSNTATKKEKSTTNFFEVGKDGNNQRLAPLRERTSKGVVIDCGKNCTPIQLAVI